MSRMGGRGLNLPCSGKEQEAGRFRHGDVICGSVGGAYLD
jgi:hypothetical protein